MLGRLTVEGVKGMGWGGMGWQGDRAAARGKLLLLFWYVGKVWVAEKM